MKKRLLSALLALALVFVLLPTTALAGEVSYGNDYDIAINGIKWKFEKNDSGEYIPVYYYANNKFSTDADDKIYKFYTNDNLMLTKKGDTVTISFRRGTSYQSDYYHQVKFTIESKAEGSDISCIEMGNGNNLVITGESTKGTLILTRDGKDGIGAALSSKEGNITITGGATVNVTFKKQSTPNVSGHAISVDNHDLIISGEGTTVEATNRSGASQNFSNDATVKVENGRIDVSGGAWLKATNEFSNNDKLYPPQFKYNSYYSSAISGDKDAPCTVSVTGENSCIIASAHNSTKYVNTSMGQAYRWANFKVDGAKIEVGTSSPAQTITDINDISNYKYAKISVPALQRTSDVLIAKENAVVGVRTSLGEGNGYYTYNKDTKTLTLEDVSITNVAHFIQFWAKDSYTIELKGTNTITGVTSAIRVPEKGYNNESLDGLNVTITGTGSLNVTANTYAIDMQVGNLIFNSTGNITLTTNTNYLVQATVRNALHVAGKITIDNTKYDIVGKRQDAAETTETISDSSEFDPAYLNGYTVGGETTLFKTITITPAAAKDSTISYGGTTLKQGETIYGETSGTATVDRKNNTITLNNFKGDKALVFNAEFTPNSITLIGDSTLSAVETKYQNLTISGSGSLTVGSIKVHKGKSTSTTGNTVPNLTINGATVTASTPELTNRAIDIDGDLTVKNNATLTATSKSDSVPTVQVGGNATFTGRTVTITNHSNIPGEQNKDSNAASSALHVDGAITISGGEVTATVTAGGNAIRAVGNITVSDGATVTATNNSQYFSAITAGQASGGVVNNLSKLIVSGESTSITATNSHANSSTGAIHAYIKNANEGYYLKANTDSKAIAPNDSITVRSNSLTITRGDEVTRTNSPVVIDGTTLLNDTYYTITNGSKVVANGSESNYNAFYNSTTKTLKLNNAKISTTTKNAAIKISEDLTLTTITVTGTNELKGNYNHCIESYDNFTINGTGKLNMTNTNSSSSAASVIHCGPGKSLTIAAEVIIKNEAKPGNLILTVTDNAYSFAEGYNVYASTDVSGSPLETYDAAKSSTYKYLCVTKENLAPTTPTPQTPFTIYGIPAQFVDGGMIATTGVTATSSNNINLPIDRVEWYTFTPGFRPDGSMDSVINKTKATGNFEAGKYYVVEIRFVQDLSPFESWDMKVSGWSDNDVSRQSETARNDIEIYFLTPASAATHEHNWVENYDTVYHWKMCTYDGCTAIKDKALHVWNAWHTSNNEQQHSKSCSECSYSTPPHDIDLAYVSDGEQGHHLYCKHDGCTFVTGTTAHVYAEGSNICTDCGYNKSAPCDHTGDRAYTNNGDGTHKVTCKACGATIVEKQNHEFNPTGACIYCGATQSGGDPTPDNPGTIVIIRPAEEEKPAQQPNPSTGANDLVGMAVAAAVVAVLGSVALLRKHD